MSFRGLAFAMLLLAAAVSSQSEDSPPEKPQNPDKGAYKLWKCRAAPCVQQHHGVRAAGESSQCVFLRRRGWGSSAYALRCLERKLCSSQCTEKMTSFPSNTRRLGPERVLPSDHLRDLQVSDQQHHVCPGAHPPCRRRCGRLRYWLHRFKPLVGKLSRHQEPHL